MFININILIIIVGLFIGGLFLSFYYGFKYASTHDFIKYAEFKNDEPDDIEVVIITNDKTKELMCVLNKKYKKYANQIDKIINNKEN